MSYRFLDTLLSLSFSPGPQHSHRLQPLYMKRRCVTPCACLTTARYSCGAVRLQKQRFLKERLRDWMGNFAPVLVRRACQPQATNLQTNRIAILTKCCKVDWRFPTMCCGKSTYSRKPTLKAHPSQTKTSKFP